MSDEKNIKKNYKIVKGNITDLELSPVSEHITPARPRKKSNSTTNNIVIPKEKNS